MLRTLKFGSLYKTKQGLYAEFSGKKHQFYGDMCFIGPGSYVIPIKKFFCSKTQKYIIVILYNKNFLHYSESNRAYKLSCLIEAVE